jgi:putative NADH-flavin reductase
MQLIIFGATGTIGKQLVLQALAMGHRVTAFARNPSKMNDIQHPNLSFASGDVLSAEAVEKAMPGHDAVLVALGAGRKGQVRAEGTQNVLKAMQKTGVRRLVCQTTLGCGDSHDNLNFFWEYIMFGWFLKDAFLDHELQERYIRESGTEWTIVRPAAFTDGPATGQFRHGFPAPAKGLKLKISRADVAMFMLAQLESDVYLHQTPGLSY